MAPTLAPPETAHQTSPDTGHPPLNPDALTRKPAPASGRDSQQEAHFHQIADAYVRSRREIPATRKYHQYWDAHLHDMIHPKFGRDALYLDPMCGAGLFLETPLSRFDHVYATDLSDDMLDYIEPHVRSRLTYCGKEDALNLPYGEGTFDIILIRGGLHHIANHLEQAFDEFFRVLKPGGQLLFSEPTDMSWPVAFVRNLLYTKTDIFEDEDERGLLHQEIIDHANRSGFVNLTMEPFTHAGYCMIGNTDFFPLFSGIRWNWAIDAIIGFDEISRKIPVWNQLCWIANYSCFKPE